jgi:hypothetical protein
VNTVRSVLFAVNLLLLARNAVESRCGRLSIVEGRRVVIASWKGRYGATKYPPHDGAYGFV